MDGHDCLIGAGICTCLLGSIIIIIIILILTISLSLSLSFFTNDTRWHCSVLSTNKWIYTHGEEDEAEDGKKIFLFFSSTVGGVNKSVFTFVCKKRKVNVEQNHAVRLPQQQRCKIPIKPHQAFEASRTSLSLNGIFFTVKSRRIRSWGYECLCGKNECHHHHHHGRLSPFISFFARARARAPDRASCVQYVLQQHLSNAVACRTACGMLKCARHAR